MALAIHPPLLYTGYVGFSMAFSSTLIAVLILGRIDFGLGLLGAALDARRRILPHHRHRGRLLVGLLHAWLGRLVVLGPGRKRVADALAYGYGAAALRHRDGKARQPEGLDHPARHLTFSLSLLGTFLVRSGVINSVHSFASDPARGLFILMIVGMFTAGGLALFGWRASTLTPGSTFAVVSREAAIVLNNLILSVCCGIVIVGTLYPLVLEAITVDKITSAGRSSM